MSKYFDKFPLIYYDGKASRNILARVDFSETTKNNSKAYMPHRIDDAIRADLIAQRYYDDPGYDWIYYLSNNVIDPYYDVHLSDENLNKKIISKYGSLQLAINKIAYYINNWATTSNDDISIANYNALSISMKKYYTAKINYFNEVVSYKRKETDFKVNTNKLRKLTVSSSDNFTVGSIYTQIYNSETAGTGELVGINDTEITFKNISGDFVTDNTNYILDDDSDQIAVSAVTNPLTTDPIPSDEITFWSAVSYYDIEREENEERRNVKLLRNSIKNKAEEELKRVLRL